MLKRFFITGTDTSVGKTVVSRALLQALASSGKSVAGYKPVAKGSKETAEGMRNKDALVYIVSGRMGALLVHFLPPPQQQTSGQAAKRWRNQPSPGRKPLSRIHQTAGVITQENPLQQLHRMTEGGDSQRRENTDERSDQQATKHRAQIRVSV